MKALIDAGYKCWETKNDPYGTTTRWQARIDSREGFDESTPLCQCNDKLLINVSLYEFTIQGLESKSAEIYLCHENTEGEWCDFKIYSLTWDELEAKLPALENKLLNIWKEMNK